MEARTETSQVARLVADCRYLFRTDYPRVGTGRAAVLGVPEASPQQEAPEPPRQSARRHLVMMPGVAVDLPGSQPELNRVQCLP